MAACLCSHIDRHFCSLRDDRRCPGSVGWQCLRIGFQRLVFQRPLPWRRGRSRYFAPVSAPRGSEFIRRWRPTLESRTLTPSLVWLITSVILPVRFLIAHSSPVVNSVQVSRSHGTSRRLKKWLQSASSPPASWTSVLGISSSHGRTAPGSRKIAPGAASRSLDELVTLVLAVGRAGPVVGRAVAAGDYRPGE